MRIIRSIIQSKIKQTQKEGTKKFQGVKGIRFREVDKMLKKGGWYEVKQRGSHHQYLHPTKSGKVTVPEYAGKDIHPDIVKSIMKQAGL